MTVTQVHMYVQVNVIFSNVAKFRFTHLDQRQISVHERVSCTVFKYMQYRTTVCFLCISQVHSMHA